MRLYFLFAVILVCQICMRDAFESANDYSNLDYWMKLLDENRKVSEREVRGNVFILVTLYIF